MNRTTRPDPLGYTIKRTQQALRGVMDKALSEIELTTPQYAALSEVSKDQGLSNADLARRCFVTPQTMHQILGGLETRKLLNRSPHPEHGRIQQIQLTKQGEKALTEAYERVREIEREMTAGLSKSAIDKANELLEQCCEVLEEMGST